MFPVIVIAAMCPYPDDPPVSLDDAYRFNVSPEIAHLCYGLARDHHYQMRDTVYMNNCTQTCRQWEAEVSWRRQCWSDLEDVLFWRMDETAGLERMRRLREMLGPRDYYGGRMPTPTPNYGPGVPPAVWRQK